MPEFLRGTALALFGVILLGQANAHAQMQSSAVFEATQSAGDYNSIIEPFSIDELRRALLDSWKNGLNPESYWNNSMEQTYTRTPNSAALKAQARQAYIRLLQTLYTGSVNPALVGNDVKLIKKAFVTPKQLQAMALASGRNAEALVRNLEPQNPPYGSAKEAMRRIYSACTSGAWTDIQPINTPLRYGSKNKVIVDIKKRLTLLGYQMTSFDDVFDAEVLNAISDIQWNLRFKPDGEISPNGKVWNFLSVSCMDRVRQIQADMEKMRWFPTYFEDRYIFINLAMSYFLLVDKPMNTSMVFRTINGRSERKSPTMRDEIVRVIFNPYWIVPPTIFFQDKVADLKSLTPAEITKYFNDHNYEVFNSTFTQRIDPATVNWQGIANGTVKTDIYIRQKPHLGNALGVLKFDLTNSFSIYLHDTNQRELFNEAQRQLSSGCVRLEKPFDLAEYLLVGTPWNRAAIETIVARPGEVVARPTEVYLNKQKHVPVYMAYLTSQYSGDGVVRFVDDVYGQNAVINQNIVGGF